jgi:hypothetical protein
MPNNEIKNLLICKFKINGFTLRNRTDGTVERRHAVDNVDRAQRPDMWSCSFYEVVIALITINNVTSTRFMCTHPEERFIRL